METKHDALQDAGESGICDNHCCGEKGGRPGNGRRNVNEEGKSRETLFDICMGISESGICSAICCRETQYGGPQGTSESGICRTISCREECVKYGRKT